VFSELAGTGAGRNGPYERQTSGAALGGEQPHLLPLADLHLRFGLGEILFLFSVIANGQGCVNAKWPDCMDRLWAKIMERQGRANGGSGGGED
jgi:hypothetical protein